jgi:hypothetical protein
MKKRIINPDKDKAITANKQSRFFRIEIPNRIDILRQNKKESIRLSFFVYTAFKNFFITNQLIPISLRSDTFSHPELVFRVLSLLDLRKDAESSSA